MGFTFDIKGQLNNMNLAENKALWPLFEAVVNAIQSIEDSPNRDDGKIVVVAKREDSVQLGMEFNNVLPRFESFTIIDNGNGLNSANYSSFQTAYSTLKIQKGCKGIGRFLWLKAFKEVVVHSTFFEDGKHYQRDFTFTEDGISKDSCCEIKNVGDISTTITLKGFLAKYKNAAPVELQVVAKKIIEHCLPFFISGKCPEIEIRDGLSENIVLNAYFDNVIKNSLHQDHFILNESEYVIYHLRLPDGATAHELHLCANMQEVTSIDLKRHIANLQKKIVPNGEEADFYYQGYLTSRFLDTIVNSTRTRFEFDEADGQNSLFGTSRDELLDTSISFIEGYLADYLNDIKKEKKTLIDSFVANDYPSYRYLLYKKPEVYDEIPAGVSGEALEAQLHKQMQKWETEIKQQGVKLREMALEATNTNSVTYRKYFEEYWSSVTEISKTCLAEYVTRRKVLLDLLEDALTIQDNGRFQKEEVIHSIICPMRQTSNTISFEEMNLWIIDERLAYHQFLASDKTIKSLPEVDSNSTKEVDLAVFDRAFAYAEDENIFSTITIVEFKKPDNKKDNPINQLGVYVDEIREGKRKRANGLALSNCSQTFFRCYAVCDMTPAMELNCRNAGLQKTPDGQGFFGFQLPRNAYFEVLSYTKLLADAKKRNAVLFNKLFSPKLEEIMHVPDIQNSD